MTPRPSTASHRLAAVLLAVTLVLWLVLLAPLILLARLPNERSGLVLAVFPPSLSPAEIFAAIVSADADIVRTTWFASVWVVASDRPGLVGRLRQEGAWAAFEPIAGEIVAIGGCIGPVAINRPGR